MSGGPCHSGCGACFFRCWKKLTFGRLVVAFESGETRPSRLANKPLDLRPLKGDGNGTPILSIRHRRALKTFSRFQADKESPRRCRGPSSGRSRGASRSPFGRLERSVEGCIGCVVDVVGQCLHGDADDHFQIFACAITAGEECFIGRVGWPATGLNDGAR